jgi:adenylate cyclase
LIDQAETGESSQGFGFLGNELDAMAVTPLLAPEPIAWLCPGFRVDDDFAREIKAYTDLEITFASGSKFFATTLNPNQRGALLAILHAHPLTPKKIANLRFGGETFLTFPVSLPVENGKVVALLQRSLDQELAPYLRLERTYLLLALFALAISAALGLWIARSVSQPVLELAEGAEKIAHGDYQHRVPVREEDELGTLATSFNQMSEGLAERDRVRDLLGKVISPQVATELLQKGMALGGEEREVTILFSDLRNFTAISEALPPQETVAVLNNYFTCVAAIVEQQGGVVDKYLGDGLMALFGAPLAHADDADRAMETALEISDALDELNRQWARRGLSPIDLGVGINTDIVVAGNMGSERRLNYTVVGDGVNLASRLQDLTRSPDYAVRIIVSGATLAKAKRRYQTRRLGEAAVKGKQNTTEIFGLLGRA